MPSWTRIVVRFSPRAPKRSGCSCLAIFGGLLFLFYGQKLQPLTVGWIYHHSKGAIDHFDELAPVVYSPYFLNVDFRLLGKCRGVGPWTEVASQHFPTLEMKENPALLHPLEKF